MPIKTFLINAPSTVTFTDEELQSLQSHLFTEGILGDPDSGALGMAVLPQTTPDKTVDVGIGIGLVEITTDGRTFKTFFQNTLAETLTVADNNSGSTRVDTVIAFLDTTQELDLIKTGIGEFRILEGTSGTAKTDAQIDLAVGSGNWLRLADITVADSFTAINSADITDKRKALVPSNATRLGDVSVTERDTSDGGFDQEQTTFDHTIGVGEADSANSHNRLAQSFIPQTSGIRGVILHKRDDNTATDEDFTGSVTIEIQSSHNNQPSGTVLATHTFSNSEWKELPINNDFNTVFADQYEGFVKGQTYWIVISTSTADNDNHPRISGDDNATYANGQLYSHNTADGWTAVTNTDLYFRTLDITENKIVKTNNNGEIPSHMLASQVVFTDLNIGETYNGNATGGTDWKDYLVLDLANIWELYILLKITLYISGGASPSYTQNLRMLIGIQQVFDINYTYVREGSDFDDEYNAKAEINLQCSNSINEAVAFTQTLANFNVGGISGGNTEKNDHINFPHSIGHENDHHTDTDLASRTIKLQVKNNSNNSSANHRFRGIVVEKATVDNQHRQYYPPI